MGDCFMITLFFVLKIVEDLSCVLLTKKKTILLKKGESRMELFIEDELKILKEIKEIFGDAAEKSARLYIIDTKIEFLQRNRKEIEKGE